MKSLYFWNTSVSFYFTTLETLETASWTVALTSQVLDSIEVYRPRTYGSTIATMDDIY